MSGLIGTEIKNDEIPSFSFSGNSLVRIRF